MMKRFLMIVTVGLLLTARAEQCVWTGGAGDGLWSSAANWTVPPQAGRGDTVTIDIGGGQGTDSPTVALTNDIVGLSLAQLKLLGSNDVVMTLSGNEITLNPTGVKGTFPAFTNHCSLVIDTPLRVSASCMLAFYGQNTTVNGDIAIDDGLVLRLRSRVGTARAADVTLIGSCSLTFNGHIVGPKSELRLIFGGNGNGVTAPFNAPIKVAALYLGGENTAQGSARLKASGNEIDRLVFAARPFYLDVDNAFTTNTVIQLGKYPDGSAWYWGSPKYDPCAGIVIAPNTTQIANRLDGRPILNKYGAQRLRSVDKNDKSCAATLHLRGTDDAVTYVTLSDILAVLWEPTGDYVQDFRDSNHDCYGALAVKGGTMRSSGTNSFVRMRSLSIGTNAVFEAASTNAVGVLPSLNTLDMAKGATFRVTDAAAPYSHIIGTNAVVTMESGAKFVLPSGTAITVDMITVDGAQIEGQTTYTGTENPMPGDATQVDWIEGEGTVTVREGHRTREPHVISVDAGWGGLESAINAVKKFRKSDVDTPLVLELAPGDHCLNGTKLTLTYEHARNVWAPLTIRAADAANPPRILCGVAVTNVWKTKIFDGRADVWTADVSSLSDNFGANVFWFDGKVMTFAQWPNKRADRPYTTGFAYVDATYGSIKSVTGWYVDEVPMREGDGQPDWANPSEGMVRMCPRHNWSADYYSIVSVSNGLIRLKASHEAPDGTNHIWDRYTMIGQRENLDQAGEWYLDKANGLLHFIPPDDRDPNDGFAALCPKTAAITVSQGENISFERLDFTCGYQAMSISSLSDSIKVRACRFHHMGGFGGRAVTVSSASNVTISDCDFYHLGGSGVSISDSLKTCDGRSNLRLENCYIHHVGETHPHGAGVSFGGQGNAVVHNLIHDCGRCGITGYGRFNEIAYNRIRHVNVTSDDTSSIYGGGWNDGVGVRIHHNWVSDDLGFDRHASDDQTDVYYAHHSNQAWGIYLDEADGGTEVSCNLVSDNTGSGAMHLHSARWATITNNVFVFEDCGVKMMSFQSWKAETMETRTNSVLPKYEALLAADPGWTNYPALAQSPRCDETTYCDDGSVMMGNRIERNIFYYNSTTKKPAHTCSNFNLATNRFDYNLYWPGELDGATPRDRIYISSSAGPKTNYYFNSWQTGPKEDVHSLVADPQFETPPGRDGKLKATSPAFSLGIAPLDVADKAGLQITEWRTELPVEEEGAREHHEYLSEPTTWTAGSGAWGVSTNWDRGVPTSDGIAIIPANVPDMVVAVTNTDAFPPARLTVGASGDTNTITVKSLNTNTKIRQLFSGEEMVFAGKSVLLNEIKDSAAVYTETPGGIARLYFRDNARFGTLRYESFYVGNLTGEGACEAIVEFASSAKHSTLGYGVYVGSPSGKGTLNVRKGYLSTGPRTLCIGGGNGSRYTETKLSGGHGTLNVSGGALYIDGGTVSEGRVKGLVVGESSSKMSKALLASYTPWRGEVNLSGGVITNTCNCLIGGARGSGAFVQTGGTYIHREKKYPFIVGCAGGVGDCLFQGGTASIAGEVYVGGVFTNAIPHSKGTTHTLGAYNWPVDDHSAVGTLTYAGGTVTITNGNLNLGFDGTGIFDFGGAKKKGMTITGNLVLSNAIVRIAKQGKTFYPLIVTGKVINSANARFEIDRKSFTGVTADTLLINATGGWEGPAPVQTGKGATLQTNSNGLTLKSLPGMVIRLR